MEDDDERIKITIEVAQRPLTISIEKAWERYFREAEIKINQSFLEFAKKWRYKDQQDLMSMLLVDFVVKWLVDEERLQGFDEELMPMVEALKALTDKIEN